MKKYKIAIITCLLFPLFVISGSGQTNELHVPPIDMNTELLKKMKGAIENLTYPNIHSVLIHHKGDLVYEEYFSGKDEAWGTDLGIVHHTANTLHDLRSLTKSIVSICIGIAIQEKYIESVDDKVFTYFPEYEDLNTDLHKALTIKHLLTMTSGMEWNEDIPYNNPKNSETAMLMSDNPIRYVLSLPLIETPGTSWNYNGGTTELLAAIINKATGKDIEEFAVTYLFTPLEIKTHYWAKAPGHKYPVAASGLRMLSKDILKIGVLLLNDGFYKGNEIISKQWIEDSFTKHVKRGKESGYGYQFWVDPIPDSENIGDLITAVGNGGQRIFIDQKNDLVVVTTAGNYNLWNIKNGPLQLFSEYIYPAFKN